jgi:hypothetical protein
MDSGLAASRRPGMIRLGSSVSAARTSSVSAPTSSATQRMRAASISIRRLWAARVVRPRRLAALRVERQSPRRPPGASLMHFPDRGAGGSLNWLGALYGVPGRRLARWRLRPCPLAAKSKSTAAGSSSSATTRMNHRIRPPRWQTPRRGQDISWAGDRLDSATLALRSGPLDPQVGEGRCLDRELADKAVALGLPSSAALSLEIGDVLKVIARTERRVGAA